MGKITRAENLPLEDDVYLKKDFIGWRVVEAWKDPITNKINWFNLITGGKRNLVFLFILFLMGGLLYLAVDEQITNYKIVVQNPCDYCTTCHRTINNSFVGQPVPQINYSLSTVK